MTDFEYVFGPRPFGAGDRAMKSKQRAYDFEKARFKGIVEQEWPAESLALYDEIGIGMPIAYRRGAGSDAVTEPVVVAFPAAMYHKLHHMTLSTALSFPNTVWQAWLKKSIAEGHYIPDLSRILPGLPNDVTNQNEANKRAVPAPASAVAPASPAASKKSRKKRK